MRRLLRLLTIAIASLVLAAGLTAPAQAAPRATPLASFTGCPEFIVYGIRGSGEDRRNYALGQQLAPIFSEMQAVLGAGRVGAAGNGYPAVSVKSRALQYAHSVRQGVEAATADLRKLIATCSAHSRIAVLAYSQGADVARRALRNLTDDELKRIYGGVYLFGDPHFSADELTGYRVTTHGNFDSTQKGLGFGNWYAATLLGPGPALPSTPNLFIRTYCFNGDGVCQGGYSFSTHYGYAGSFAAGVAWRIVGPTTNFAKPVPQGRILRTAVCEGFDLNGGVTSAQVSLSMWESTHPASVTFTILANGAVSRQVELRPMLVPQTFDVRIPNLRTSLITVTANGAVLDMLHVDAGTANCTF